MSVNDKRLIKRDALGVYETESLTINSNENSELIIIEVPMKF